MKCLIVDDEPIALEGMTYYINKTGFLELSGSCENAIDALEFISTNKTDLIFLDINMPELSGIEMLKALPNPPMIIFTTAYSKHALEGFELNAVDYLLKPISYARFLKSAQKALELFNLKADYKTNDIQEFTYVKVDKKIVKVVINDIVFVESLKDYIRIHTKNEKYVTCLNLKKIHELLPANKFIQVHKSFVIAIDAINKVEGNMIELRDFTVPIGRQFKQELFDKIINKNLIKK